jgi:hypothetical protein
MRDAPLHVSKVPDLQLAELLAPQRVIEERRQDGAGRAPSRWSRSRCHDRIFLRWHPDETENSARRPGNPGDAGQLKGITVMSTLSRRGFLNLVGKAGGVSAVYQTMAAMGLLSVPAAYVGPPSRPAMAPAS